MPASAVAPAPGEAQSALTELSPGELSAAVRLADEASDAIAAAPKDFAAHARTLHDLKLALVELADRGEEPEQAAAESPEAAAGAAQAVENAEKVAPGLPHADLVWDLARALPDFSTQALYQKRSSLAAMAGMAVFGWFLGGVASTVLGWLGLGGDILRAFGVWAMFWLSEYLSANPRARRGLLTVLGMGALGRFAMAAMSGMLRLTSWGSIRQAIFGAGRLPNIFKVGWLLFGAFFVLVFLSKKITSLDMTAFRHSLREQAEERLRLAAFVLGEVEARDAALAELRDQLDEAADGAAPRRAGDALARDMLAMLDGLDDNRRRFLLQRLSAAGYTPESADADWLIWEPDRDAELYDTVGLVREGDRCRILRRAMRTPTGITRGLVQRAPENAGARP
ncbi:MAG: adenosine deaminase [Desulfovibrio sp.]|nr:adenosine deaminase [Desulfovibrio sp.]